MEYIYGIFTILIYIKYCILEGYKVALLKVLIQIIITSILLEKNTRSMFSFFEKLEFQVI